MSKTAFLAIIAVLFSSCDRKDQLFELADPSKTGVVFSNNLTESDDFNILDYLYFYNGGGVSIGDINNDGLADIFLSGNQVSNKLYLNQGALKFSDISEEAGVTGISDWHTGSSMADVNNDGYLDIYVCAVVGLKGLMGYNELYINNGDNTFREAAKEFGLDFENYSSSASFFDYDLDGDLDLYLLNHAVHTQESFGRADLRSKRDDQTGDKLLRNEGGSFVDVSEAAGIYGGSNGYGLGVSILDFNHDGYPDIYVSNDFHEDDYFYVNNGDGTFTERTKTLFSHTSRFSMGVDATDINHDGKSDILTLDMLPNQEKVLKSSVGDENYNLQRLKVERFGYHYQYARNMLQLNRGDFFQEIALLSNVASTDWSWSVLMEDFDNDTHQDIFISNGIPRRPNDLDYIKFVSSDQIKNKISSTKLVDQEAMAMMPSGAARNFFFQGSGDFGFEDLSSVALPDEITFSNAIATGDLDNDGDLDLVINNINSGAGVYVNRTGGHYLRVKVNGQSGNFFGLGTKVFVYHGNMLQYKELYTSRGFQGSSEPILHFGLGQETRIDSVRIIWPNKQSKLLTNIVADQLLTVDTTDLVPYGRSPKRNLEIFQRVPGNLGIDFVHKEDRYVDFDRQNLIPYMVSDRGPASSVGDVNNDGLKDVLFGGSKYVPTQIFEQKSLSFQRRSYLNIESDSVTEVVDIAITDFSGDNKSDILIGTGGADFFGTMEPLLDSYYEAEGSTFVKKPFPDLYGNASIIAPYDFDRDGDQDVFIGNHTVSSDFGSIPISYIIENENGNFKVKAELDPGMVTDAKWRDIDEDGNPELIVIGEWFEPTYYLFENGTFEPKTFTKAPLNGLWQSLDFFDIDKDGDQDVMLGNWGSNTKLNASQDKPLKMFYGDLDENGSTETILAQNREGVYYPVETLDNLSKQMVGMNKKFRSYRQFAGTSVKEVFGPELAKAKLFEVHELRSGFLRNDNGQYTFIPFDWSFQVAPITSFLVHDFDSDEETELLVAGNYFGIKPYHGRFGSFPGALIYGEDSIIAGNELGLDLFNKSARSLDILEVGNSPYLLVTINNDSAQVYQVNR